MAAELDHLARLAESSTPRPVFPRLAPETEGGRPTIPFFEGLSVKADYRQYESNRYPITLTRTIEGAEYNSGLLVVEADVAYLLGFSFTERKPMLIRIKRDGTTSVAFPAFPRDVMDNFRTMQEEAPGKIHTPIDAMIFDGSTDGSKRLRDLALAFDSVIAEGSSDIDNATRVTLHEELDVLLRQAETSLLTEPKLKARLRSISRGRDILAGWAEGNARGLLTRAETIERLQSFGQGDLVAIPNDGLGFEYEGGDPYPTSDRQAWMGSGAKHRVATEETIVEEIDEATGTVLSRSRMLPDGSFQELGEEDQAEIIEADEVDETSLREDLRSAWVEMGALIDNQRMFERLAELGMDVDYKGIGIRTQIYTGRLGMEFTPEFFAYNSSGRINALHSIKIEPANRDSKIHGVRLTVAVGQREDTRMYTILCEPEGNFTVLSQDGDIRINQPETIAELRNLLQFLGEHIKTYRNAGDLLQVQTTRTLERRIRHVLS